MREETKAIVGAKADHEEDHRDFGSEEPAVGGGDEVGPGTDHEEGVDDAGGDEEQHRDEVDAGETLQGGDFATGGREMVLPVEMPEKGGHRREAHRPDGADEEMQRVGGEVERVKMNAGGGVSSPGEREEQHAADGEEESAEGRGPEECVRLLARDEKEQHAEGDAHRRARHPEAAEIGLP